MSTYSQPVQITPTRFLGYGGKGWTDPALNPDGDQDVEGHLSLSGLGSAWTDAQQAMVAEIARVARLARRRPELLALED